MKEPPQNPHALRFSMKKSVPAASIGNTELGKDPKKNISASSFHFLSFSSSAHNCDHSYPLINILMSISLSAFRAGGSLWESKKEIGKSNTSPFTFQSLEDNTLWLSRVPRVHLGSVDGSTTTIVDLLQNFRELLPGHLQLSQSMSGSP